MALRRHVGFTKADGASGIEARLRSYGFDQHAISMEVYVQAREILMLFESPLNGAQLRRLMLLKEMNNLRRSRRARLAKGARRNGPQSTVPTSRTSLAGRPCMAPQGRRQAAFDGRDDEA